MAKKGAAKSSPRKPASGTRRPVPASRRPGPRPRPGILTHPEGWTVAVGAGLLALIAFPAGGLESYFAPRLTVLLVLAGLGLPFLVVLAWRSPLRWPARAALAFLAVGLLSTVLSPAPDIGFFGYFPNGTGWFFLVALASVWALGAAAGARGSELLERALLVVATADAVATLLESAGNGWPALGRFENHLPDLAIVAGRVQGTSDNSVFAAQLVLGGLGLLAYRADRRNRSWWLLTVLLSAASMLIGERIAIPLILLGLLLVLAARGWGQWRQVVALAGAVGAGYGAGLLIERLVLLGNSTAVRSSTLITSGNGAVGPRVHEWSAALRAVGHHPLLGIGPSQSQAATTPLLHISLSGQGAFFDTHNFLLEIVVTTGLFGLACFSVWFFPSLLSARGPLPVFAIAVLAGGLVEPLDITTTSLAFLALGSALAPVLAGDRNMWAPRLRRGSGPPEPVPEVARPRGRQAPVPLPPTVPCLPVVRAVGAGLALAALIFGVVVTVGAAQLTGGQRGPNLSLLTSASNRLWWWPDGPKNAADLLIHQAQQSAQTGGSPQAAAEALTWTQEALRRDPTDWTTWGQQGDAEFLLGHVGAARADFQHELRLDPLSSDGYKGLALVAIEQKDVPAVVDAYRHVASLQGDAASKRTLSCLVKEQAAGAAINDVVNACFQSSASH